MSGVVSLATWHYVASPSAWPKVAATRRRARFKRYSCGRRWTILILRRWDPLTATQMAKSRLDPRAKFCSYVFRANFPRLRSDFGTGCRSDVVVWRRIPTPACNCGGNVDRGEIWLLFHFVTSLMENYTFVDCWYFLWHLLREGMY